MSSQRIPAVAALQDIDTEEVYLIDQNINVIGRAHDAFICVKDPKISRKHYIVERSNENKFTVRDVSTRGFHFLTLNGYQLEKNHPYEIKHHDIIKLADIHTLQFLMNPTLSTKQNKELTSRIKEKMLNLDISHLEEAKKLDEEISNIEKEVCGLKKEMNNELHAQENIFKQNRLVFSNLSTSMNQQKENETKLKEMEEKYLQEKNKLKEKLQIKIDEITKKETELQEMRNRMEERHKTEREELEQKCNAEINLLKEKLAESEIKQGQLQGETREVEQKLEECKMILFESEMEQERIIKEKVEAEIKLENKIIDLTQESTSKDETMKMLENKLKEKEEAEMKLKREMQDLEEELQCSVCAELFIEPMVLNCGHMFCKMCIDEWQSKKKNCPSCRCRLKSVVRIFTVDSIIEKNVALLSKEAKERRQLLIIERQRDKSGIPTKKRKQNHRDRLAHRYQGRSTTPPVISLNIDLPPAAPQPSVASSSRIGITLPNIIEPTIPIVVESEQRDLFAWPSNSNRMRSRTSHGARVDWIIPMEPPVAVAAIDLTNLAVPLAPAIAHTSSTATSINDTIDLTSP